MEKLRNCFGRIFDDATVVFHALHRAEFDAPWKPRQTFPANRIPNRAERIGHLW